MNFLASRKRRCAEDVCASSPRGSVDFQGKAGEEVAGSWASIGDAVRLAPRLRRHGSDAAKELKECASRTPGSNGCWPRPNWKRMRCARWPRKNSEPSCQAPCCGHAHRPRGMSERLACKAVGLARSTYRRLPSRGPRPIPMPRSGWLRSYATEHPCHGFRRAWAALRYDERREVNKKKVHRLWREEGLQVRCIVRASGRGCRRSRRSRPTPGSGVGDRFPVRLHHRWQGDQDRLDDRRTHPRAADASGGRRSPPSASSPSSRACSPRRAARRVLRMDNGPELVSQALQRFCDSKGGIFYVPQGKPWNHPGTSRCVRRPALRRGVPQPRCAGTACTRPGW